MNGLTPKIPDSLDPLAREILERLRRCAAADRFVIGGHLALKHYLDFRATHDINAWWNEGRCELALAQLREVLRGVAAERGLEVAERGWGDVVSLELLDRGRKIFSVQVAARSVELEAPSSEPWGPLWLESLADNVGAKMNALVDRGAPRDFVDVREVVRAGLYDVADCWALWVRKNPGREMEQARRQVAKHLSSIELRRPLEGIENADERVAAEALRSWFRAEFLRGGTDAD